MNERKPVQFSALEIDDIAQLVEDCTRIVDVIGLNPV